MDNCEKFFGIDGVYFASKKCSFTSAEIAQQPEAWRELCGILSRQKYEISDFFKKMGDVKKMRIILSGAGSSGFVGEAAAYLLGKISRIRCEAIHTTEIVSAPTSLLFEDVPTLLVSFARSGNSPESSGAVKYARSIIKNLYEAAILCDGKSGLAEITGQSQKSITLVMPEKTNDKGFAMTSSVTSMLLACIAFFNIDKLDEIIKDIRLLAENIEKESRRLSETAQKWARKNYNRLIVIGSGCCKGLARESALKSMELTMGAVNTNYDSSLAFRHGPKAVINDQTLTVHFISNDPLTAQYDLDLLKEIQRQKKGNMVIALSGGSLPCETDETILIPAGAYGPGADICQGISYLVFCQLLAMFKSLALGLSTDNPVPSGELTRVVSGVTLYELGE